jgi:DNA-binding transcriptional ArsR family regulator
MQVDDMLSRIEDYFHVLHLGDKSLDLGKILSTDTSIKILEAVYNSDEKVGLSTSEISEALGVGRTTVIYHLGRMQESGLVRINPVLEHDANWEEFWDLYRKGRVDVSREQFNRLHDARMNGVKLFVSTKKGFLVLPSTDVKAGQSIVREALASITAPARERDYRRMVKTTSVLGTLGLLLLTLSFLFQGLPFLQYGTAARAPAALVGEAAMLEEELAMETPPPGTAAPAEAPGKPRLAGAPTREATEEVAPEEETYVPVEEGEERAANITSRESVSEPIGRPTVQQEAGTMDRISWISKVFSYAGTLLLGSVLGFLLYSYIRKR